MDVAGSVVPSNCPVVARSPAGVLSHGGVDGPVRPSSSGSVVPSNCPVVARSPAGVVSHGGVDGPVRLSSSGSVVPSNCPVVARSPAGVLSHGGVHGPLWLSSGSVVPSNRPVVACSPAGVLPRGGVDGPVRPSSSGSVVPSNCPVVRGCRRPGLLYRLTVPLSLAALREYCHTEVFTAQCGCRRPGLLYRLTVPLSFAALREYCHTEVLTAQCGRRRPALLYRLTASLSLAALREYCHTEVFTAQCGRGTVVRIDAARYGRMQFGRCVKSSFGFVGCYKDVLGAVAARCSGRTLCRLAVPDAQLEASKPCNEEFKSYLAVSYTCVAGEAQVDRLHRATHTRTAVHSLTWIDLV